MEKFLIRKETSKNTGIQEITGKPKAKKRKYQDDYLKYGFIASESDETMPFCLLCLKVLSTESMNPSKLSRHLETKHPEQKLSPVSHFENLRSSLQKQSKKLKKYVAVSDQGQVASYLIAQLLAKKKKTSSGRSRNYFTCLENCSGMYAE